MDTSLNASALLLREISDIITDEQLTKKVLKAVRDIRRKAEKVNENRKLENLFGAWKDDRSAEDIINDIYSSRKADYDRHIESFDE